jgi:anti-sigma factor RsiW
MEVNMRCAESLRVQACFDGELDAVSAAEIERHAELCVECCVLLQELGQLRFALRQQSTYDHAPAALRSRILRALDGESAKVAASRLRFFRWVPRSVRWLPRSWSLRPFWTGAFSGIGGAAIAASIALFMLAPRLGNPLVDELMSAHVRSLMPAHLIDVVSTDKHTVKPWFAGHTDVSPVVADFEEQGYRLMGGRADYFDGQRAAAVVYQHGAHIINVFSWAAARGDLPSDAARNGYHLAFWRTGDLAYCAVSDAGWDELLGLARLLQDASTRDAR